MNEIEYAQALPGESTNIFNFFFKYVERMRKQQLNNLRNEVRILQMVLQVCV